MRKRHQQGSLKIVRGRWVGQWWEKRHRRNQVLGNKSDTTRSQALNELAAILSPINNRKQLPTDNWRLNDFVNKVYLPFYRRKWKRSTAACNIDRLKHHVLSEFTGQLLRSFSRDELQEFLERKAAAGLSFSTVDHLRWDLKQIFDLAVSEDCLSKNPADLLFTPRAARRIEKRVMSREEVKLLFSVLDLRERLVCMLAVIGGMRPGEIFGLQWRHMKADHIEIEQRLYRGQIDTPKTTQSVRSVALSEGLQLVIAEWRRIGFGDDPEGWVFPSEKLSTPLAKDNCWRRGIGPRLEAVGIAWVNFQVMRRTSASLMRELSVDPKTAADQLGHSVDVNLNVYSKTALGVRREAANVLESAFRIS